MSSGASHPRKLIKVAHSPDSDDAFMFYAIRAEKIYLGEFEFTFSSDEIETLNQRALTFARGLAPSEDIIAVSFHAFKYISPVFTMMNSGASMGSANHGPRLVSKTKTLSSNPKIAIPGQLTSAFLVLQKYLANAEYVFCKFDEVFDLLASDTVEASLLIHESQLKYSQQGYHEIVNLGTWWHEYSGGLNMPLGCNAIKKSLGEETTRKLDLLLCESIKWGLANMEETLLYARTFAKNDLNDEDAQSYIEMYVNESTIQLSKDDWKSIELLLSVSFFYE